MIETNNVIFAFLLTLLAGISTAIGVVFINKENITDKFLSLCLGFSAGVMIYVALIEIFQKGLSGFISDNGAKKGYLIAITFFFLGNLLMILIDKVLPEEFEPTDKDNLLRLGIISAVAVSIHNFPEGFATFIGTLYDTDMGIGIAMAIAIHNIPEGIIIAIPVYVATKSKKKAFILTLLSGLTEPVGALIGFILFKNYLNDFMFGIIFSLVSGIMVYISINELLPSANEYGDKKSVGFSFIVGMLVMAISLYLFM